MEDRPAGRLPLRQPPEAREDPDPQDAEEVRGAILTMEEHALERADGDRPDPV